MTDFIYSQTLKNAGCSVNSELIVPSSGCMVSLPKCEVIIPVNQFTREHVKTFVDRYSNQLKNTKLYVGTWVNDNKVYMDISVNYKNIKIAKTMGRIHNQLAVYNVSNQSVVNL